jgi:hypothetical protein
MPILIGAGAQPPGDHAKPREKNDEERRRAADQNGAVDSEFSGAKLLQKFHSRLPVLTSR